jgi:hypothetical protein
MRTTLWVPQQVLPWPSFVVDGNPHRNSLSLGSKGQRTLLRDCRSTRQALFQALLLATLVHLNNKAVYEDVYLASHWRFHCWSGIVCSSSVVLAGRPGTLGLSSACGSVAAWPRVQPTQTNLSSILLCPAFDLAIVG